VLGPIIVVSLWAGGVAIAAIWYGKEVGLTNNVGMYASYWEGLMG
jgi:hypothetical protein